MFGATSQFAGALTSGVVILAVYLLMPVVEVGVRPNLELSKLPGPPKWPK